ncbi:MAG: cobyrinate a,c-diamide synthase [Oscillospiraceae bacterium]
MNRIMMTGTHSGCGKTTVTCALLKALKKRGISLSAFKCGPDYIDPMFHRSVLGISTHNLDPFFCDAEQLKQLIVNYAGNLSILEGAMGYYDGVGPEGCYSAYDVARETETPAVLVVDAKGMYASAGAVLKGFLEYRRQCGIQGVIFNNASPMLYEGLGTIAKKVGVKPLGFLPSETKVQIESRHLGLVTVGEIADMEQKIALLGDLAEQYIDIEGVLALAASAPPLDAPTADCRPLGSVRIAVARDNAFCFMYEENLEMLRARGCEIVFFSPLDDVTLPDYIGGLYLCGGYPELYAKALSGNATMLQSVNKAVLGGIPTIAECGGFLYLHDTLDGFPMVGAIHAEAYKTEKLRRFGYLTLHAKTDNLFCAQGGRIRAHEFHYYESTDCGTDFIAEKPLSARSWPCIHATQTLYAGFPHLYFDANPVFAENFVGKAIQYAVRNLT